MRKELDRRPLLHAAAGLCLGLISLSHMPVLLVAIALLAYSKEPKNRLALLVLFIFGLFIAPAPEVPVVSATPFEGKATVVSVPRGDIGFRTCQVETNQGCLQLEFKGVEKLSIFDQLWVKGSVHPLREVNEKRLLPIGIRGQLKVDRATLARPGLAIFAWGAAWRDHFMKFAEQSSPKAAATLDSLVFNADWNLDQSALQDLQRSGTIHIISASGLHVAIFVFSLERLFGFLPIPRGWRVLLLILVLAIYAGGAGLRPPVFRSVVTAAVSAMPFMFRREKDFLSALALSAILYLLWRPTGVYDVGFQLSFVTLIVIGLFVPPWQDLPQKSWSRLFEQGEQLLKMSCFASLGAAPLVAYHFGFVSIIAPVANLVIAPALPAACLLALGASAIWFLPRIALLAVVVASGCAGWILMAAHWMAQIPFASLEFPDFSGYWLVLYYTGLLMIAKPLVRPAE